MLILEILITRSTEAVSYMSIDLGTDSWFFGGHVFCWGGCVFGWGGRVPLWGVAVTPGPLVVIVIVLCVVPLLIHGPVLLHGTLHQVGHSRIRRIVRTLGFICILIIFIAPNSDQEKICQVYINFLYIIKNTYMNSYCKILVMSCMSVFEWFEW